VPLIDKGKDLLSQPQFQTYDGMVLNTS
jgi:hypothetical protein